MKWFWYPFLVLFVVAAWTDTVPATALLVIGSLVLFCLMVACGLALRMKQKR